MRRKGTQKLVSGTRAIRIDPDVKRMLDEERKPHDPNYSVVIRRLLRKAA